MRKVYLVLNLEPPLYQILQEVYKRSYSTAVDWAPNNSIFVQLYNFIVGIPTAVGKSS